MSTICGTSSNRGSELRSCWYPQVTSRFFRTVAIVASMSLTTDDLKEFTESDPEDDETVPLGDALSELAVDVEVDAVDAVRDVRERI